jgi:hypothetical protein
MKQRPAHIAALMLGFAMSSAKFSFVFIEERIRFANLLFYFTGGWMNPEMRIGPLA